MSGDSESPADDADSDADKIQIKFEFFLIKILSAFEDLRHLRANVLVLIKSSSAARFFSTVLAQAAIMEM